jgi:hypothetical protein
MTIILWWNGSRICRPSSVGTYSWLTALVVSHQDESTIEFSDALGDKGNVDRASGEVGLRES